MHIRSVLHLEITGSALKAQYRGQWQARVKVALYIESGLYAGAQ
jgi:hypothetical protein